MINFQEGFVKLGPVEPAQVVPLVTPMLIDGEQIIAAFKTIRDMVVFTNKRIIAINVQGITGKKTAYTSLPYSKVQTFAVQTAGTLDRDCELELWFSAVGKVHFEIKADFNIVQFSKILSQHIL